MKCLTGIVKPKSEKSGLKELDFFAHRRGWLGLGDAIPNKFCPVYTQGGTCSTNCDFNGAPAGFSRLASGNNQVLMGKDAMAIGRFQSEREYR